MSNTGTQNVNPLAPSLAPPDRLARFSRAALFCPHLRGRSHQSNDLLKLKNNLHLQPNGVVPLPRLRWRPRYSLEESVYFHFARSSPSIH